MEDDAKSRKTWSGRGEAYPRFELGKLALDAF